MLSNTGLKYDPKVFEEYQGQTPDVALVKKWVLNVNNPGMFPQSVFVSGPSGVGKTALVRLMIRAVRCLDRQGYNPCNNCANCKQEIRLSDWEQTNVIWVQAGREGETVQSQVKQALEVAQRPRASLDNSELAHQIMFVVFDEFQEVDVRSRRKLLLWAETPQAFPTCYIYLTMESDRFAQEELKAFVSRSFNLNLLNLTRTQIRDRILDLELKVSLDAANLIAEFSFGSLRLAYSMLERCLELVDHVDLQAACVILKYATPKHRRKVWHMIEHEKPKALREYLDKLLTKVDELSLAKQLHRDIIEAGVTREDEDLWFAQTLLYPFTRNLAPGDLSLVLTQLQGRQLGFLPVCT